MRARNPAVLFALLLLSAPALGAPAPSGPDALPALVAGVVGSGDQLSLELKPAEGMPQSLKIGGVFEDGWVLTALTNTTATLTRDGASRTVGLNPTGALAAAAPNGAPTTVRTIGLNIPPAVQEILNLSDDEVLARAGLTRATLSARAAQPGLTQAETQRLILYQVRYTLMAPDLARATQANVAAAQAAGQAAARGITNADTVMAALYPDYADLTMKTRTAVYQANQAHYQAATAAGLDLVVADPTGAAPPQLTAYPNVWARAGNAGTLVVMALAEPTPPRPVGQLLTVPGAPTLTAAAVAALHGADGAPLSTDVQAALLQSNRQLIASQAAGEQAQASAQAAGTIYGPFGLFTTP